MTVPVWLPPPQAMIGFCPSASVCGLEPFFFVATALSQSLIRAKFLVIVHVSCRTVSPIIGGADAVGAGGRGVRGGCEGGAAGASRLRENARLMAYPPMTEDEMAILAAFARHFGASRSNLLPVRELMAGMQGERKAKAWSALRRLADRGWLAATSPLHIEEHHECILLGEGLKRAIAMSQSEPPERAEHPRPSEADC